MSHPITIQALPITGTYAIDTQSAEQLHDMILCSLRNSLPVIVDFAGVSVFTSVFLNVAIGRLYGEFTEAFLKEHLSFVHLPDNDHELLQVVISNAKEYFTNPIVKKTVDALAKRYRETGEI